MRTQIIAIGDSQGIHIPKEIIEQCGFDCSVEMQVVDSSLVLTPVKNVREGWAKSFQAMAANGNDELLIDDDFTTSEDEDWQWKENK